MNRLILLTMLLLTISGCGFEKQVSLSPEEKTLLHETLPEKVASLPLLNLSSVDSFENYIIFVDRTNGLLDVLNEKQDMFDVPRLNPSRETWDKLSKVVTEYGPLIGNYQSTIVAAQKYEQTQTDMDRETFYKEAGKFSLEAALIGSGAFYKVSYETVGVAYRAVGFNRLALECGSCVRIVLSEAHWVIRGMLVDSSDWIADKSFDIIEDLNKG